MHSHAEKTLSGRAIPRPLQGYGNGERGQRRKNRQLTEPKAQKKTEEGRRYRSYPNLSPLRKAWLFPNLKRGRSSPRRVLRPRKAGQIIDQKKRGEEEKLFKSGRKNRRGELEKTGKKETVGKITGHQSSKNEPG